MVRFLKTLQVLPEGSPRVMVEGSGGPRVAGRGLVVND
jgi:hypothetical protein